MRKEINAYLEMIREANVKAVKITDMRSKPTHIEVLRSPNDTTDTTYRDVYNKVVQAGKFIELGKLVGEPLNESTEKWVVYDKGTGKLLHSPGKPYYSYANAKKFADGFRGTAEVASDVWYADNRKKLTKMIEKVIETGYEDDSTEDIVADFASRIKANKKSKETDLMYQELVKRDSKKVANLMKKYKISGINMSNSMSKELWECILKEEKSTKKRTIMKTKLNEALGGKDTVTVNIPLLIRLLEYSREDAKTDMDLHIVAENMLTASEGGKVLTMADYESLLPGGSSVSESEDKDEDENEDDYEMKEAGPRPGMRVNTAGMTIRNQVDFKHWIVRSFSITGKDKKDPDELKAMDEIMQANGWKGITQLLNKSHWGKNEMDELQNAWIKMNM